MALWHQWLYKLLFAVGLGWKYNRLRHYVGLYPTFPDGRCHWCGLYHYKTSHRMSSRLTKLS